MPVGGSKNHQFSGRIKVFFLLVCRRFVDVLQAYKTPTTPRATIFSNDKLHGEVLFTLQSASQKRKTNLFSFPTYTVRNCYYTVVQALCV